MTTILDRSARASMPVSGGIRNLVLALTLLVLSAAVLGTSADAKTPGSTYCFLDTCHRVRSIAETSSMVGRTETLVTSFYDDCRRDRYNPCGLTSSGEAFRSDKPDNAASPIYPDGTTLLIFNPASKRAAVVRINNAGPYWGNRKLDVSRAAAEKLGFKGNGVAKLQVKVLRAPSKTDATYKKNRKYEPVRGYVGKFASLDAAAGGLASVAALAAVTNAILAPVTRQTKLAALATLDLTQPRLTGVPGPKPTIVNANPSQKPVLARGGQKSDVAAVQKRGKLKTASRQ